MANHTGTFFPSGVVSYSLKDVQGTRQRFSGASQRRQCGERHVRVPHPLIVAAACHRDAAKPGAPAVWDEQPDNVCFVAELGNRAAVDAAYAAGMAAGGKDEGKPGLRTHYHPNYYGAYIRDPDGNEVELYVDADESTWKANPAAVLSPIKPLAI